MKAPSLPQDELCTTSAGCLRLRTQSPTKPIAIDLTAFFQGTQSLTKVSGLRARHQILRKGGTGKSSKPFRGRPELITQLTPAFRELYLTQSASLVRAGIASLRAWFRFFETIDAESQTFKAPVPSVNRVEDIGDVHRQLALDMGMRWQDLGHFKLVLNLTRKGLGLSALPWPVPERPVTGRFLPEEVQMRSSGEDSA